MIRLLPWLIVVSLLAACAPPPAPTAYTFDVPTPSYPRVAALFSQPDKATATQVMWLERLARYYDMAIFWPDAQAWNVDKTQISAPEWARRMGNGKLLVLAYAPMGYWWTKDSNCALEPTRCDVRALLDEDNLWLWGVDGKRVEGWAGQALIDTPRAAPTLNKYWRDWFDPTIWNGMAWDVTDGNFHYVGGVVDFDRNGQADNNEHGWQWLDDTWTAGLRQINSGIEGFNIGNGAWMPRQNDELSQVAPPLRGSIVELPSRWRNPETGRWEPSANDDLITWHIQNLLALKARDPESLYLVLAKNDQFNTTYWRKYLPDPVDQQRLALGVALLTDNALLLPAYSNVPWCDECGATRGMTSWQRNWLGQALGPAHNSFGVWWREFANGVVYVNATSQSYTMEQTQNGLYKLLGWYDREHNNGQRWDGKLPPYTVYVLWRSMQPAKATPTPQPSPSPTTAVTPDVADLLRRIEAIEAKLKALQDALQ